MEIISRVTELIISEQFRPLFELQTHVSSRYLKLHLDTQYAFKTCLKPNAPFPLTEPTPPPQPFFQSGQNLGVILDTSFLYLTCHPLAKSVRSAVKIYPEYDQLSTSTTSSRVQAGCSLPSIYDCSYTNCQNSKTFLNGMPKKTIYVNTT